jgi:hypothetical protein
VSPVMGAGLSGDKGLGRAILAREGKPGTFSPADHQMIDMVLPLDAGYYSLVAFHTEEAIAGGIRIQAIEALRDHRDDLLNAEEKLQVGFIRAVRDGTMTDDMWDRMKTRLGTERGVVEYVHFVLCLQYHHKYVWACGVPEMSVADFNKMLNEYKSGTRKVQRT